MQEYQKTIVVNTRLLLKNKLEGIGRFASESLRIITQQHPEIHFYFLFDRDYDEEFIFSENITPIIVGPQARHPFLFYWWFEQSIVGIVNKINPNLFLSPDGYLSLSLNKEIPCLPVIHDINFEHHPKSLPFLMSKYYRYFFPKFAKKAKRIATVSEFSKNDIHKTYSINKENIDVVYNGCSDIFSPRTEQENKETKKKISDGEDFFIFVSSIHPRKNLENTFKAFDLYKEKTGSTEKLVLVGDKYFWPNYIKNVFDNMKHQKEVVFTGHLKEDKLSEVLAAAKCLLYVSYFEGFGIPIIEAMACGIPVICSNTSSMPEVAEDAAIIVNPHNADEISEAMIKLNDIDLRNKIIEKGLLRHQYFTWQNTADLLWKSIEKTMR
jgi:glycosyltransferase involved in cell wall biosynthesis